MEVDIPGRLPVAPYEPPQPPYHSNAARRARLKGLINRSRKMRDKLDSGEAATHADLASLEGLSTARVFQMLGLLQLAPEIQDDINNDSDNPCPTERVFFSWSRLSTVEQLESWGAFKKEDV